MELDHLVIAAHDLDAAMTWFHAATGVQPWLGGAHPGRGTRNALVACGPRSYLELLAPDSDQSLPGTFGEQLLAYEPPALLACMLRSDRLDDLQHILAAHGVQARLQHANRSLPDGTVLAWRLLIPESPQWGGCLPLVIDWGNAPHPSAGKPATCTLEHFEIVHPRAAALARMFDALGCNVPVGTAAEPGLLAELATPRGRVTLASTRLLSW